MPKTRTLTDVPEDEVEQTMQDFRDEGAKTVTKKKQPNGKYTVTAVWA